MASKDVAVPIVSPDYLIAVNTPTVRVDVPDFLPDFRRPTSLAVEGMAFS